MNSYSRHISNPILLSLISVEDLLLLIDKYDVAVLREKCAQYLINSSANSLFKLRIADKYGLAGVEVKIWNIM